MISCCCRKKNIASCPQQGTAAGAQDRHAGSPVQNYSLLSHAAEAPNGHTPSSSCRHSFEARIESKAVCFTTQCSHEMMGLANGKETHFRQHNFNFEVPTATAPAKTSSESRQLGTTRLAIFQCHQLPRRLLPAGSFLPHGLSFVRQLQRSSPGVGGCQASRHCIEASVEM